MIEQLSNAITFYAHYTAAKVGKTGLTVTVDVYEGTTATPIVNDAAATELAGGLYYYTLASGSVDAVGNYIAIFATTDATVDQKELPAIWTIGTAGIENFDATISSRAATGSEMALSAGAVTAAALATDAGAEIADAVLSRGVSNVEATADAHSLTAIILAALESSISGTTWTIKKTDGATTFVTKTVTVDGSASPITAVT